MLVFSLQLVHYAIGLVVAYTVANTYHPEDASKIKIWMGLLGLINTALATAGKVILSIRFCQKAAKLS